MYWPITNRLVDTSVIGVIGVINWLLVVVGVECCLTFYQCPKKTELKRLQELRAVTEFTKLAV